MGQAKVINHQAIKNYNRNKILKLLSEKRQLTKQDIALETKISIPTVTNNIEMLIEEGLVEEAGMARSTGGRRAMMIRYLPDARHSFGIDISPVKIRIALSNLDGKLIHDESFPFQRGDNLSTAIGEISSRIQITREKFEIDEKDILGIGFSLPGTVNRKTLALETAPNLGLKDISFTQFEKTLRYPLFLENEANAAVLAEQIKGNNTPNLVYISVTCGVGCGIIKDGQLYRGKNQRAGEFGHMSVETHGKKCSCGRTGCWELYVSNTALVEHYEELTGKKTDIASFISLANQGELSAVKAWDEYLDYLAMGVENIILGIDPGAVVIGGEIARLGDLLVNPLRERVFIANTFDTVDDIQIITSSLGGDAPITGAAMLPVCNYLYN